MSIVISTNSFSQKSEVTQNPDGKSITVNAVNHTWFDALDNPLSEEQFKDSLKTGKYHITIYTDADTAKTQLVSRYPNRSEVIGTKVPLLIYNDILGQPITIGENANISVLSFWSITCGPCIRELSVLNVLAEEYPDINFYAITTDDKDTVMTFLSQKNYKWDNIIIIPNYNKKDYNPGINTYPATIFFDKERIVKNVHFRGTLRPMIAILEGLDKKGVNK